MNFSDLTPEQVRTALQNLHKLPKHQQDKTLELIRELTERRKAERRRSSLLEFIKFIDKDYKIGAHHRRLATMMEDMAYGRRSRVAVNIAPRFGKLLADETPVLTPNGWTTHGQLQPGDYVFHPSGRPVQVVAISEKAPANVKVTFGRGCDEESFYCHENHEWTLTHSVTGKAVTRETNAFMGPKALKYTTPGKREGLTRATYFLPDVSAVEFPEEELPLHPYALGVWLGDGSVGKPCITHHVDDIQPLHKLERLGFTPSAVFDQVSPNTKTTNFGGPRPGVPSNFRLGLVGAGVLNDKHIPRMYVHASIEQRMELLAGLIDTDGTVDKNGRYTLSTTLPHIADAVEEIVISLGWSVYRTTTEATTSSSGVVGRSDVIQVGFSPLTPLPTVIPRKAFKRAPAPRRRGLWGVEYDPQGKVGHCIQVDSPDGLYLVGRTLTPTHNSQLTSIYFPAWFIGNFPHKKIMMVSHTADLAVDFGRKVRNIVDTDAYKQVFPDVSLAADSKSAGRWDTNKGGTYFAVGIGGAIAGRGADLLCVQAESTIITRNGVTRAKNVTVGDYVWAFTGFERVEKRFDSTHSESVVVDGVEMSLQHPVWTYDKGWLNAGELTTHQIVDTISIWSYIRLFVEICYGQAHNAWIKPYSHLQHLGADATEMHQPEGGQLPPVRRAWRNVLRTLGKVCGVFRGYGASAVGSVHAGPDRQYQGVRAGELPLGGLGHAGEQPQQRELDNGVRADLICIAVEPEARTVAGRDIPQDNQHGDDAGAGVRGQKDELGAAPSSTEEFGWLKRAGVRFCSAGRKALGGDKGFLVGCFEAAIASRLFGLLVGVRRLSTVEYKSGSSSSSEFCNFQVERSNTFYVGGLMTHNCIDDPHSERSALAGDYDAFDKAYDWYAYGARTRLMPGGAVALVMTRWHAADMTGRVVQEMQRNPTADQWDVVEFPALLDYTDEEGKTQVKSLWPEQWSVEALLQTKATMPTFQWNAQYMQQPTSAEAAIIKREWWQEWEKDDPPACDYIIMSLDAAAEKNNRADFTSLTTWGVFMRTNENGEEVAAIILLNAIKERWEFPELKRRAYEEYKTWAPDWFVVEKKSAGTALYQEMRAAGIPVQEFTPHRGSGDKTARLNSVADIFASGMVWYPAGRRWAEELVDEVCGFPAMANDDQVDTTIMALMRFRTGGFIRLPSDRWDESNDFQPRRASYY